MDIIASFLFVCQVSWHSIILVHPDLLDPERATHPPPKGAGQNQCRLHIRGAPIQPIQQQQQQKKNKKKQQQQQQTKQQQK